MGRSDCWDPALDHVSSSNCVKSEIKILNSNCLGLPNKLFMSLKDSLLRQTYHTPVLKDMLPVGLKFSIS